jgi:ribosome-binding protein aMBF1 (putative translation factor)
MMMKKNIEFVIVLFLLTVLFSCQSKKSVSNFSYQNPNNNVGEVIRKQRIVKGITQEELANAINISQNSLSLIEDGLATPIHYKIKEIEALLDISLNVKY